MFGLMLSRKRIKLLANIVIEGLQELQSNLKQFVFDMDTAIDDAVRVTAFKVNNTAIDLIKDPSSSGRFVSRGDKARHEISKEGDAPNVDQGLLWENIGVDHKKGSQEALVTANVEYATILETTHNRPFMEPAKMAEVKFFSDNLANAMDSQIKKAGK